MKGRRTRLLADRHHRSTDSEVHDIFEADHPAVDDRQAGSNAARLDMFAVVAAEAAPASKPQHEATTADREMAAFGPEGTRDVLAVILQIHIVGLAHIRIPVTGAANSFRGL